MATYPSFLWGAKYGTPFTPMYFQFTVFPVGKFYTSLRFIIDFSAQAKIETLNTNPSKHAGRPENIVGVFLFEGDRNRKPFVVYMKLITENKR